MEIMLRARTWLREHIPSLVPVTDLLAAPERARRGDRDAAIDVARTAIDEMYEEGRVGYFVWGTGILVDTLLERGAEGDLVEAQEATDRLAALPTDEVWTMRDVWLLRLRALLARARGDDAAYRAFVGRYREKVTSLGFEGHIAWADAMTEEDN
jgi:hypothetical protein